MLPLLISNPCLKDAYCKTQTPQYDRNYHSAQGRHHDVSRTAPSFHPLLNKALCCRSLHMLLQIGQPIAPVSIAEALLIGSSIWPRVDSKAIWIEWFFADQGAKQSL